MVKVTVEFIVFGEVQGVGYRDYVAKIGRRLKLAGLVENLKDGTVRIRCKGDGTIIDKFREQIDVKKPEVAPLINVEKIIEKRLEEGQVTETVFEEKYGETAAEMAQGFSTGMGYMNHMRADLKTELHSFRVETIGRFDHMDAKYDRISSAMLAVVHKLDEKNQLFKGRMEKTERNIETLLKILARQTKKGVSD